MAMPEELLNEIEGRGEWLQMSIRQRIWEIAQDRANELKFDILDNNSQRGKRICYEIDTFSVLKWENEMLAER